MRTTLYGAAILVFIGAFTLLGAPQANAGEPSHRYVTGGSQWAFEGVDVRYPNGRITYGRRIYLGGKTPKVRRTPRIYAPGYGRQYHRRSRTSVRFPGGGVTWSSSGRGSVNVGIGGAP